MRHHIQRINLPRLSKPLTIESLIKLTDYPFWNYINIVFDELKEYKKGVEFTRELIAATLNLQGKAKPHDISQTDKAIKTLWCTHLKYLDYADEWYEYIKIYDFFRNNHPTVIEYFPDYRYKVILKKIRRLEAGKRVDYLKHKQSYDLTEKEYEDRKNFALLRIGYCEKIRWIFNNF